MRSVLDRLLPCPGTMGVAATVLLAALEILGAPAETSAMIHLVDERPADVSPDADAFVRRDPDAIYIVTTSPVFVRALQAERPSRNHPAIRLLASVLAHELWHIHHGPNERRAYHMQLTTLLMLGYSHDSTEYQRVIKAMRTALRRPRTRQAASPPAFTLWTDNLLSFGGPTATGPPE